MIVFNYVKYKNFLSTGNTFTEVKLDSHPNTLVVGKNGNGKSSFTDAIAFGLFGRPFRNINKPQLVNSINQKDCVVDLGFTIGKTKYKVIRGLSPAIFEIYVNDKLLDQTSKTKDQQIFFEQTILKMDYKTFTQVVMLGSAAYVPFMELKASDRRSVVEDILDIQIFSTMNVLLKQKILDNKAAQSKNSYEINVIKEKITLQKNHLKALKDKDDKVFELNKQKIAESMTEVEQLNAVSEQSKADINLLEMKLQPYLQLESDQSKLTEYKKKIKDKMIKIVKSRTFYEDNNTCPTCTQSIHDDFKKKILEEQHNSIAELEAGIASIDNKLLEFITKLKEAEVIRQKIKDKQDILLKNNSTIMGLNQFIAKLQKEMQQLLTVKTQTDDDSQQKLEDFKNDLVRFEEEKNRLVHEQRNFEVVAGILKDDGIKTKIIKQYIPVMNKLINKYLTDLDFFVNFTLDENFTETIKSRYRDEFSYASFSEGEKFRINIALLLTWRDIARLKNSANCNLLIFDEVFDSSLDATGTEETTKLIKNMPNTNVFLITHKNAESLDSFSNILKFDKVNNFSKLVTNE